MKRRNLLKAMSLVAGGGLVYPVVVSLGAPENVKYDQTTFSEFKEIARNVFFAEGNVSFFENGNYQEAQCNNGFIIFERFVLVIDSNFPSGARVLLDKIRSITDKPVKLVFNTHHHGDHVYGNDFWSRHGTSPIAYVGLIEELKKYETGYYGEAPGRWDLLKEKRHDLADFDLCPAALTFDGRMVLKDKEMHVELMHLGKGHTLGDAIAWLPKEGILFAGDSCLTGPYNLLGDAHVGSWIETLSQMDQLRLEILVPGHGKLGTAATVGRQRSYLKHLFDWVTTEKMRDTNWDGVQSRLPELRDCLSKHEEVLQYLIAEPGMVPGFSLEAHAKKIFDELTLIRNK